jgi:hypothetical protein
MGREMTDEPTLEEIKLAKRVNELDEAATRPQIASGGLLSAAAHFVLNRVSRPVFSSVLVVFIAYHGWEAINTAQQLRADLDTKRAQAGQMSAQADAANARIRDSNVLTAQMQADLEKLQAQARSVEADAAAQNHNLDGQTVRLRTVRAELETVQQQARATKADADAQNEIINGGPMRLQTMRAELAQIRADSDQARADADAATQTINGIPVAVAQKRADVAAAEAQAKDAVAGVKLMFRAAMNPGQTAVDAMNAAWPWK